MKIFKRPMFRKGGESMTGIMENIAPRQNYAEQGKVDFYDQAQKVITEKLGPVQKGDPLTDFLLTYGPSLASSALPGGTMRNIVAAAEKPVANLLASRKAGRDKEEARKLAALQLGESMAERQLKKDIAGMKAGVDLLPTFLDLYEGNLTEATNRNNYEKEGLQTKAKSVFGDSFKGIVGGDRHGDINSKAFKTKKRVGDIYYDITDGQFKRIRKTTEGFGVEVVDIDTYDATAEEAAKVDTKKPKPGLFGQKKKPDKPLKEILPDFSASEDFSA
tara:strand:+ start:739 stop:1563 length:825 start_codon:yes stop_codon:yes gene_type:complete